jgi:hypothetical protein
LQAQYLAVFQFIVLAAAVEEALVGEAVAMAEAAEAAEALT